MNHPPQISASHILLANRSRRRLPFLKQGQLRGILPQSEIRLPKIAFLANGPREHLRMLRGVSVFGCEFEMRFDCVSGIKEHDPPRALFLPGLNGASRVAARIQRQHPILGHASEPDRFQYVDRFNLPSDLSPPINSLKNPPRRYWCDRVVADSSTVRVNGMTLELSAPSAFLRTLFAVKPICRAKVDKHRDCRQR